MASLNPPLALPCRGGGRVLRPLTCDACGYRALWSPDPVAATIPRDDEGRIWLLRREHRRPWRETREEIELDVGGLVGVHSRAQHRVVPVVFAARRPRHATRN